MENKLMQHSTRIIVTDNKINLKYSNEYIV